MDNTSWLKQAKDNPLFADMLWSRPENRRSRGKLLVIGGNSHSFTSVSAAYGASAKAGIGTARVMLPNDLERMLGKVFAEAEFAPSSPSGSFARISLGQFCEAAAWGDGVLLAGDFGRNSETAVLLESFIKKYGGNLTAAGDSLEYFINNPSQLLERPQTTIVTDLSSLQKILAGRALIKHSMDLIQLISVLGDYVKNSAVSIITHHAGQIIVAAEGQVSITPTAKIDLVQLAAYASVWQLQQPGQPFEALTCAAYSYLD